MSLQDRIQSPTPDWFKRIIRLALTLAAVGTALLTAEASIDSFILPMLIKHIAQYLVVGGIVAAAVSKTAKEGGTDALIFIGILLCLVSCTHRMMPPPAPSVNTTDSIHEQVVYKTKDSIIQLPGDTVKLHDSFPCPEAVYHREQVSKSGRLSATVDLRNGVLNVDCKEDSLQKRIEWLEANTTKERFKTVATTYTVTVTAYKNKVPKWCWYLLGICVAYVGARVLISRFKIPIRL